LLSSNKHNYNFKKEKRYANKPLQLPPAILFLKNDENLPNEMVSKTPNLRIKRLDDSPEIPQVIPSKFG